MKNRKIRQLRHSRSFKVIDVIINQKPICDFLLVINSNWHPMIISYRFGVITAYCSNFGHFGVFHVTYLWNFGTPSISWVWFELETSTFACRLIAAALTIKMKKMGQRGSRDPRDLLLEFRDPLLISGTVWARNFKFGMQIDHRGH